MERVVVALGGNALLRRGQDDTFENLYTSSRAAAGRTSGSPLPPDTAFTSAAPDTSPAKNVVVAMPLRVCVSTGSTRPRLVVNRTVVPFWTGVPPCSRTMAESSADPPVGSVRVGAESVMVELAGAVSCTLSQPTVTSAASKPTDTNRVPVRM